MGYSFDGTAKVISLTAGTTEVEVDDLWSRWLDWIAAGNQQYPLAMRLVGGDSISATKKLGVTFFMINGWRIRPQEANHTLRVNGNLYTDPAGFSPFVSTVGSYNVTIEMTVSSLVDSTLAQISEIEQSAFNEGVTFDPVSGTDGVAYPYGTGAAPCKTWANVTSIAATRGFTKVYLRGDWSPAVTDNMTEYHIHGEGATLNATRSKITFPSAGFSGGGSTSGAHFYDVRIVGPQSGETNYHECIIEALSNSHCHYDSCGFLTPSSQAYTIQHSSTIGTGHITDLHNCYGDEGAAIIDRNGSRLNQRYVAFCGNITFKNQNRATDSGTIWLNMNGGTVTIDSSCTTGVINISGVCNVVNNSGGTTVDVTQVTAAWSNPAASFNAAGSMGAQLNAAGAGGDPWAQTIEGSFTAAEVLRIVAAALAGQRSGIGTATETYRGLDGSTNRIVLTPDSNGNGTPVLDGS